MLPIALAAAWLGMASAVLFPGVESSNDILTRFVVELFPVGLKGLVLVGILAAVMSTADICILTASANVTRDVVHRYIDPDMSHRRMLRLGMLASLGTGLAALALAWGMQDIIDILLLGFTVNGAALFLPTMIAMYRREGDATAAFWSISASLLTVVGWKIAAEAGVAGAAGVEPLWPGLAVSFLVYFGVAAVRR
jgi:SSS family solute:Na+ symporter